MENSRGRRFRITVLVVLCTVALIGPSLGAQERGLSVLAREVTGKADFDAGKQYAVVIGIDKYREWPSLRSAASEAKAVRNVLAERYYIDEFFELYDGDATAANIRRLFVETLPKKVSAPDSLLIFYAGHGQLDASKTGFWIASDGTTDAFDQRGWVGNAQLRNMIGGLKAQRILILADACFSGDFLNVSRGSAPVIDSAYYRKALQLTARQVLTSGASETVPDESEFGRQLLNLLERNQEPLLDPVAMYERIRRGVTQTVPLLGTMPGNENGASFVLFRKGGVAGGTVSGQASVSFSSQGAGTADIMVKAEGGPEVFVDGVSYGKAPVLVKKLAAGRPVKVSARTPTMSGDLELTLNPGELREVSLSLAALTGNLYVQANEASVNLWIDGLDKGDLGSGLFKALPVGSKRLELRGKDLFGEARAEVGADETQEVRILVRPVGRLVVDGPDGVPVRISGGDWSMERMGGGTFQNVPAGSFSVSAGGNDFIPVRTTLNLAKGQSSTWKPYSGGAIEFAVMPEAAICSIDGASGIAAKRGIADVAPGTRSLVLRKPGYRDRSIAVNVSLGKSVRVEANLERLDPAVMSFPDFGIELRLESRTDADSVNATNSSAGTSVWNVAAGVPQILVFSSAYAESVDIPALEVSFTEGEQRRIELPSGRIVLPWLPEDAKVVIGSGWNMDLKNETEAGFRSPALPPGKYRLSVGSNFQEYFHGTVMVSAGGLGEPTEYRNAISTKLATERLGFQKQISAKRGKTTTGIVSLATGILGAVGAGAVYYLGGEAMTTYRAASDSATATERWNTVALYQSLFPAVAVIGGIGLGLSPILLTGGPDSKALQRSIDALDEGIRALGKAP